MTKRGPMQYSVTDCFKCKRAIGKHHGSIVFLSRDPDHLIPLCVHCAILGCFRCGLPGVT